MQNCTSNSKLLIVMNSILIYFVRKSTQTYAVLRFETYCMQNVISCSEPHNLSVPCVLLTAIEKSIVLSVFSQLPPPSLSSGGGFEWSSCYDHSRIISHPRSSNHSSNVIRKCLFSSSSKSLEPSTDAYCCIDICQNSNIYSITNDTKFHNIAVRFAKNTLNNDGRIKVETTYVKIIYVDRLSINKN